MIGNRQEYDIMAAVESQHWWYTTLHSQVIQAIERHSQMAIQLSTQLITNSSPRAKTSPFNLKILDAGCGTGGLLVALKNAGFNHAEGFDLSTDAVEHAKSRGLAVKLGDLAQLADVAAPQSYDVIVNNDTLYHLSIYQRTVFFKSCLNLLKPNGIMILNVPALNAFKGNHDFAVGITERFSKSTLVPFIQSTGFEVARSQYWPFVLSPIIWATRATQKFQRNVSKPTDGYRSDLGLPHLTINKILQALCACEGTSGIKPPWGSSLFLVLTKPNHF